MTRHHLLTLVSTDNKNICILKCYQARLQVIPVTRSSSNLCPLIFSYLWTLNILIGHPMISWIWWVTWAVSFQFSLLLSAFWLLPLLYSKLMPFWLIDYSIYLLRIWKHYLVGKACQTNNWKNTICPGLQLVRFCWTSLNICSLSNLRISAVYAAKNPNFTSTSSLLNWARLLSRKT